MSRRTFGCTVYESLSSRRRRRRESEATHDWPRNDGYRASAPTHRLLAREDGHLGDVRLLLAHIAAVVHVPLCLRPRVNPTLVSIYYVSCGRGVGNLAKARQIQRQARVHQPLALGAFVTRRMYVCAGVGELGWANQAHTGTAFCRPVEQKRLPEQMIRMRRRTFRASALRSASVSLMALENSFPAAPAACDTEA